MSNQLALLSLNQRPLEVLPNLNYSVSLPVVAQSWFPPSQQLCYLHKQPTTHCSVPQANFCPRATDIGCGVLWRWHRPRRKVFQGSRVPPRPRQRSGHCSGTQVGRWEHPRVLPTRKDGGVIPPLPRAQQSQPSESKITVLIAFLRRD